MILDSQYLKMFETVIISLEGTIGQSILRNRVGLLFFLKQHNESLRELLRNHWYRKRGSILTASVDEDSIYFSNQHTGFFTIKYQLSFTFACEDITHIHDERMKITFSLSDDLTTLSLQSEPEPERVDEL